MTFTKIEAVIFSGILQNCFEKVAKDKYESLSLLICEEVSKMLFGSAPHLFTRRKQGQQPIRVKFGKVFYTKCENKSFYYANKEE